MEYLHLNTINKSILVRFSIHETQLISNIITQVLHIIPVHSFQTRLGAYREEVSCFLDSLKIEKGKILLDSEYLEVEISEDNLLVLNNSFNEICYGIKLENFDEVIGTDKENLKYIFEELRTLHQYFSQQTLYF